MNHLVKFGLTVFAIYVVFSMFSRCSTTTLNPSVRAQKVIDSETQIVLREKAKGLDLAAVTAMAKKAKDAAEFEKLLNSKEDAINNLDLNEDLIVDYIKVSEYGSGDHRGFSLSTELSPGEVQEIATIDFQKKEQQVVAQTTGNSSLYGANHFFHSNFDITDALLLGWIFSQRTPYVSPYGHGNYPKNYGPWYRDADDSYQRKAAQRNSSSTVTQSTQRKITPPVVSPNAEKVAAKARALTTATQSQRSFTSSPSRKSSSSSSIGSSSGSSTSRSSGGFGRSSSSSSSRSSSFSRSRR